MPTSETDTHGEQTSPISDKRHMDENAGVQRIKVNFPPFWQANPELWFIQVEAQFACQRISSDTSKFHALVAALDTNVLTQVSDVVTEPPDYNKYGTLKKRICKQYAESALRQTYRLLHESHLGTRTPSQLLREMRTLAKKEVTDEFLRNLWLQQLPVPVRMVLAGKTDSLESQAELADKALELQTDGQTTSVTVIEKTFQNEIALLRAEIDELRQNDSNRSYHNGKLNASNSNLCYYHRRFGARARNCRPPCKFCVRQRTATGNDRGHQ